MEEMTSGNTSHSLKPFLTLDHFLCKPDAFGIKNLLTMVISVPQTSEQAAAFTLHCPFPQCCLSSGSLGTAGLLTQFSLPRDRVSSDMPGVCLNDLIQGRLTFQQREPCCHRELLVLCKNITHTHTHTHTKIFQLFREIKVCMRCLCFCFLFLFQRRCTDQVDT